MVAMLVVANAVPALTAPTVIKYPSGNNGVRLDPDTGTILALDRSGDLTFVGGTYKGSIGGFACEGLVVPSHCTSARLSPDRDLLVLFKGQQLF